MPPYVTDTITHPIAPLLENGCNPFDTWGLFYFMKQFFAKFLDWEDYINGMFDVPNLEDEEKIEIENSITMLSDTTMFDETCKLVLFNWVISSKVNLTNVSCNRRAWLGQAACSYKFNSCETSTRFSWGLLTENQRIEANAVADKWIRIFENNYERENRKIHYPMGEKLLF